MELNEQGVLLIDEQDICNMYFYSVHDGTAFKDSFRFEMQLQGIELHPGSVTELVHPPQMPEGYPEEDLPLVVEAVYAVIRENDPGFGVWS
ncbi:hypothetical protein HQN87_14470 [Paenibacillus tritici]|jgi:hypothetical protein|uniref:Uncharacterized protein n=1 Tax=Paenibacillus tritici TaxID=1873425 RepID=A0ABX2DPE1_9BACL|nr:hypothetical protein [Paenibacillus tritici]NQX46543.1 hypothetical protein [Paenibacillus tritici]